MAVRRWAGGAPFVAGVQTWAFAGTWEANDIISITVGTKTKTFVAGSTVVATVVASLVTAWNALDPDNYPEFAELTASASTTTFILTCDTAGLSFVVTISPFESDGTTPGDAQTIEGANTPATGTVSTAVSSPHHWSIAANWMEGAVPVSTDDVDINGGPSIKHGIDQNAVTLASLRIGPGFPSTSEIGLPTQTNPTNPAAGYPEYRDTRLKIGATLLVIDTTSQRVRLNLDTDQTTATVDGTGRPRNTLERALDVIGVHASSIVRVNKGNVAFATKAGEAATFGTIAVSYKSSQNGDADVWVGRGVTLTNLEQSGGQVLLECAVTTVTKTGGTLTRVGTGAVTTLHNRAGDVFDSGTGTITTLNQLANYTRQGLAALTVTTTNLYKGSITGDPFAKIVWTAGLILNGCHLAGPTSDPGPAPCWVNVGFNRTITVA